MVVDAPPKYLNGEFEFSNWHKRPRFTFLVKVMELPIHPYSCGVQHSCVKYLTVMQLTIHAQQDSYGSWVRHCRSLAAALPQSGTTGPRCGTTALAAIA